MVQMRPPKNWLITDTHYAHVAIVEHFGRPVDHESRLFKNMMKIPPGDILYHLGDICLGKDKEVHDKYIKPLKCRKWLIRGNHDHKSNNWYLNHGWDFVARQIIDRWAGVEVTLSHVPIPQMTTKYNIHGHFHNNDHRRNEQEMREYLTPQHILIAVELTNYQPVNLHRVIQKAINEGK